MDISFLTAFLGGALALLSPCGALLLPAFFASTLGTGVRLWAHSVLFYVGLGLVLVPLGIGAGTLGTVMTAHRDLVISVAALIIILMGLLQSWGIGFDFSKVLPGVRQLQTQATTSTGWLKTFLLGATSGVAGLCAGPILGAVLTMAATKDGVLTSGALLAVYGAGMVVPLLILATFWNRLNQHQRARLRGREFTLLGKKFNIVSVTTGAIMVLIGILFWWTNGFIRVPEFLPAETSAWFQEQLFFLTNPWFDLIFLVLLVLLISGVWLRIRYRNTSTSD